MLAETRSLAPVPPNSTVAGHQEVLDGLSAAGNSIGDASHVVDSFWITRE